jgi:hypothetical protein
LKIFFKFLFLPLLVLTVISCGLEDISLVHPVPQSNIMPVMNNRSVIHVPHDNTVTTFTHFAIFYRIYVSNSDQPSTTSSASYAAISAALASDFNAVLPHIDSTTLIGQDMDRFFLGRGFQYLEIVGDTNISDVLSRSSFGAELEFDFPSARAPTMTVGSSVYTLRRSNVRNTAFPLPEDRLFFNTEELRNVANIDPAINADVADFSGDRRFTYAAMFIVGVGINVATYSPIFSTPSLIHVFQLPDRW